MYLAWAEKIITDFSEQNINSLYNEGYLFTRVQKGLLKQTRSVRIDLAKFLLSSENRRILKKTAELQLSTANLPYQNYHWSIAKMAKDFYSGKFGQGTFSANKVKEIMTDQKKSNFNKILIFSNSSAAIGYAICHETKEILHYSYPFYELSIENQKLTTNTGMGMMLRAILYAQENGQKYIYLGSAQRPTDTYKLQFKGMEWFDGKIWNTDLDSLKHAISS
jgi:arginyl-tRNA--protein-N-Asp/Glu arginylyltransferase